VFGRTENRIGQLAEPEAGQQAAESRAFDAKLSGGAGFIVIAADAGRRILPCLGVERGSLSHAEPFVQGLALPDGASRA
jgi:hypothetical protein